MAAPDEAAPDETVRPLTETERSVIEHLLSVGGPAGAGAVQHPGVGRRP